MANPSADTEYPINAVSKLTGVSCHALRVWERRYGFPKPHRSISGHRRYGIDQVSALKRISELSRAGTPIGDLISALRSGRLELDIVAGRSNDSQAAETPEVSEFLERMLSGDVPSATLIYEQLATALTIDALIDRVIAPALTETGERWFRRKCTVYQERCVSGFLRRKLDGLIEEARFRNRSPKQTALLGSVQGDRHEGGVLIANVMLERSGWRVLNLGVDLPVSEYARAVQSLRQDALALSFVLSRNINKRFQELSTLDGIPVFVGGRSILNYQGLARRYGLIPVPGSVSTAVAQMFAKFQSWTAKRQAVR
jgi:DNA-binding transcriptional MerR regulator